MSTKEMSGDEMSGDEQDAGGFAYDGVRFRPVDVDRAPGTPTTVGLYHSRDGELWAEFSGGNVRIGRLVGTIRADGTIDGAYCQMSLDGQSAAGTLVSVPDRLPDGRIRLREHWRRADGSSGVSVIEEIGVGPIDAPGGPLSSAQVDHLRDEIYRQLLAHLGTAGVLAATRCATRLLDQHLAGRIPSELTIQVAHDGDAAGAYTLAFVRAVQLITDHLYGETFVLLAVTGHSVEPSRMALDNIDRACQALGLNEDPCCEQLNAQDVRAGKGADVVITASAAEGEHDTTYFSIDADLPGAPHVHRSLLADLLKYEFEEAHEGEDR